MDGTRPAGELLTAVEAGVVLRMSAHTVKRECRAGRLRASKPNRVWLIPRAAIDDYVNAAANTPPTDPARPRRRRGRAA